MAVSVSERLTQTERLIAELRWVEAALAQERERADRAEKALRSVVTSDYAERLLSREAGDA